MHFSGVDRGTRTHDNQIHNLALYQLNYIHHMWAICPYLLFLNKLIFLEQNIAR